MANLTEPIALEPTVKHYDWGCVGSNSLVARLSKTAIDDTLPYAELWLGAHPTSPSQCAINGKTISLLTLIEDCPQEVLGARVLERFGPVLPFLFKILSIAKPLSIQLHPSLAQAKELHAKDPEHYPDGNHKPEISIAIGDSPLLSGFRSSEEVVSMLAAVPELSALVGNTPSSDLEAIYRAVNLASEDQVQTQCKLLYERVAKGASTIEEQWVSRLEKFYPEGDVGVFSFFLLNLLNRSSGDAVFSPAQNPHAYLAGDLVECMANSDNTIRAGLTPKFRDVETLLSIADYGARRPEIIKASADPVLAPWKNFAAPAEEFAISRLDGDHSELPVPETGAVQLLFCLSGAGSLLPNDLPLTPGTAYLLPAGLKNLKISLRQAKIFRISTLTRP